jgi:hypothetical protein
MIHLNVFFRMSLVGIPRRFFLVYLKVNGAVTAGAEVHAAAAAYRPRNRCMLKYRDRIIIFIFIFNK